MSKLIFNLLKFTRVIAVALGTVLYVTACGGGGGSSSTSGGGGGGSAVTVKCANGQLCLPANISIINAKTS